jgi:hypothetical protein
MHLALEWIRIVIKGTMFDLGLTDRARLAILRLHLYNVVGVLVLADSKDQEAP